MTKHVNTESIGVVGNGVVGHAVVNGLTQYIEAILPKCGEVVSPKTFDIDPSKCSSTIKTLWDLVQQCEVIFVCVPTPGKQPLLNCDTSIVEKVVMDIDAVGKYVTVVVKSTVPPGTCRKLNDKCKNIEVLFNPEFLRERYAAEDFRNQQYIIIGSADGPISIPSLGYSLVEGIYTERYPSVPVFHVKLEVAELYKYVANTFLALKVSIANEFQSIAETLDIDWNHTMVPLIYQDKRLGISHWRVPGPDGEFGYSGMCFPKDVNALINFCEVNDISCPMLIASWERNLEMDRPDVMSVFTE